MKIYLPLNSWGLMLILFSGISGMANYGVAEETNNPSNSNSAEFYYNLGTNHYAAGEWSQAIEDFTKYIHLNGTNALAYAGRGCCYFAKGDLDKAISDFTQQIQMDPTNVVACLNRGNAHRAKMEFDLALIDYNKCLQLDPTNLQALGGRATVYNHRHEYEKSVSDLNQAIQINPNYDPIWVMRGCAHSHNNQYVWAADDFQKAIQINPKNFDAYGDLGWLRATCPLAAIRDGKEAVEMATKACELTKWKRWEYLDTLAAALAETGNFEKAAKYERQILEMNQISDKDRTGIHNRLSLFERQKPFRETSE